MNVKKLAQRLQVLKEELELSEDAGGGYDLDAILRSQTEVWEYKLEEHLHRYWKGHQVIKIELQSNLLGKFIFRAVHFEDGRVIHLCKRARIQNWNDSWWFMNERRVGRR